MNEDEILFNKRNSYFKCITAYLIIAIVLISLIYSLACSFIPKSYDDSKREMISLSINIIVSFVCNLSLFVLFIVFLKKDLKDDFSLTKKTLYIFIPLVLVSYLFVFGGEYLCSLFYSLFDRELTSDNQNQLLKMIDLNLPIMILSICVVGPFVEEVIFRKCIFGFFKKNTLPLFISALLFGLLHVISTFDFISVLPYIVTGFIFGGIYILSKRNIYASVLAHMIANTVSLLIILL